MAIKQVDFFFDTFKLLAGTVIAQALPRLLKPLFSRIFTAWKYAILGMYFSILIRLDEISNGRNEFAVN